MSFKPLILKLINHRYLTGLNKYKNIYTIKKIVKLVTKLPCGHHGPWNFQTSRTKLIHFFTFCVTLKKNISGESFLNRSFYLIPVTLRVAVP